MARHKHKPKVPGPAPQARSAAPSKESRPPVLSSTRPPVKQGPELLRRGVLGLVTALIVARPLVLGEDPGLTAPVWDATGLVLTLLWFLAAVGWAVWRAWTRQDLALPAGAGWWSIGVEMGLLAVVAVHFLSAGTVAAYRHAAWLVAWEWLALLAAFVLVRQLARSPAETRGLLAAVLAGGVSLSAYALYQYTVEMPRARELYAFNPEALRQQMARLNLAVGQDEPELRPAYLGLLAGAPGAGFPGALPWPALARSGPEETTLSDPTAQMATKRLLENNVYSTFSHPNSFAGYLALLLPALVGYALVCWRQLGWTRLTALAGGCAALVGLALWLTHSRGAILATLLVAAVAAAVYGRDFLVRYKGWVAAALAGAGGVVFLAGWMGWYGQGFDRAVQSFALRLDYWKATAAMIRDHLGLGVGPGNFGRYYPRYMVPTALEKVQDPHNFILELWATAGIVAVVGIVVAFGVFFGRMLRPGKGSGTPADEESATPSAPSPGRLSAQPWEFYVGGAAGLLLAFLLRMASLSGDPDEILIEGVLSGARSAIWFAAFALLFAVPWSGTARGWALTAGVAALLLNLTVSAGISQPSVAQPLWIVAALALNSKDEGRRPKDEPAGTPAGRLGALILVLLCLVVGVVYLQYVFRPVTACAANLSEARRTRDLLSTYARVGADASPRAAQQAVREFQNQVRLATIQLREATEHDPSNVAAWLELARWYRELWELSGQTSYGLEAVRCAQQAAALDPQGREGLRVLFHLYLRFAQQSPESRNDHLDRALRTLNQIVASDPSEATLLNYQAARVLYGLNDPTSGQPFAQRAWDLDRHAPGPAHQLSSRQREQVRQWLKLVPNG